MADTEGRDHPDTSSPPLRLRLWPAIVIIVLQAGIILVPGWIAPGSFPHFICMIVGPLLGALLLSVWWLLASRVPLLDRFLGVGLFIAATVAAGYGMHKTMTAGTVFYALPTSTTGVVLVALITRRTAWPIRRGLLAATMCGLLALWTTVRMNGMDGSLNADFGWRWASTAEDQFLASTGRTMVEQQAAEPAERADLPTTPAPGDWPGFRGAQRDGVATGVRFATDWDVRPPRELWRRRVGPGWSSFCAVDAYVFTQEQQGDDEVVVCYGASDGQPVWVNRHATRFFENVSGAGPRATPTYHEGRLYTTGAKGMIQSLDASTGQTCWRRELMEDTGAEKPVWGFSSSPLVVGDMVVVFAGGAGNKGVVAYHRETGVIAWTGGEGRMSYSSPHLFSVGEDVSILMATEIGLQALEPTSGRIVWTHRWNLPGMRIVQPLRIDEDLVLLAGSYGGGSRLLRIERDGQAWDVSQPWTTRYLNPYFNDFVIHKGHVYGFNGKIFTCVNAKTGRRCWKGGRYGYGQLLLLPDMDLLLVISEKGEAVLVKTDPAEHVEVGRFQALKGKTWNHPVIAHGRLFVRNGEEAACFALDQ
jgi:outer membrane protein assembly factor BamB